MKIAVVSNPSRPVGKTALSLMLSYLYPIAVGKTSAYLTNKSLTEVLKYTTCPETETAVEKGISVFATLSRTDTIKKGEIVDYAYRPENTNTMLFDAYNTTVKDDIALQDFFNIMDHLDVDNTFTIIDVNGRLRDPLTKQIVEKCNAILYVFSPNRKDLDNLVVGLDSLDENERLRFLPVCNIWDDRGVKKKLIQEHTKIKSSKILWVPYNHNIPKLMLEGRLEYGNRLITEGKNYMLPLRDPLTKILSNLLDSKSGKIVKEFKRWEI